MIKITPIIILISLCLLTNFNSISASNAYPEINNFNPGEEEFDFSISPNPAKEFINIKITKNITGAIFIHDNLGNQILSRNVNGTMHEIIPLHNFNSGIYIVSIKTRGQTIIKRLIKYEFYSLIKRRTNYALIIIYSVLLYLCF